MCVRSPRHDVFHLYTARTLSGHLLKWILDNDFVNEWVSRWINEMLHSWMRWERDGRDCPFQRCSVSQNTTGASENLPEFIFPKLFFAWITLKFSQTQWDSTGPAMEALHDVWMCGKCFWDSLSQSSCLLADDTIKVQYVGGHFLNYEIKEASGWVQRQWH